MTDFATLIEPARHVVERASALGLVLATAESCTGGLIAALLTEIPGSSAVVDRGFVTYSNQAKAELLGVPLSLIDAHGAVSREVALAMVEGALAGSSADMAVSVTGIAGPGGGSRDKPVGLVHFGFARRGGEVHHHEERFDAALGRSGIRLATVSIALAGLSNLMDR